MGNGYWRVLVDNTEPKKKNINFDGSFILSFSTFLLLPLRLTFLFIAADEMQTRLNKSSPQNDAPWRAIVCQRHPTTMALIIRCTFLL